MHEQVKKPWKRLCRVTNQHLRANSERPVAEPRSIEDLLFLFLGPQVIVITVDILKVTMESYGTLVRFLNSHQTHMELLSEGGVSPRVSCPPRTADFKCDGSLPMVGGPPLMHACKVRSLCLIRFLVLSNIRNMESLINRRLRKFVRCSKNIQPAVLRTTTAIIIKIIIIGLY